MLLSLSMTECRFSVVAGKGQPFYCNCQTPTRARQKYASWHVIPQIYDIRTTSPTRYAHVPAWKPSFIHNTYRHHSNTMCLKVIGDNLTATLTRDRLIETKRKSQTQFNLHVGSHDFTKFNFTRLQQSSEQQKPICYYYASKDD